MRNITVVLAMLLLVFGCQPSQLNAASSIRIANPTDGTVVTAGHPLNVSVEAPGIQAVLLVVQGVGILASKDRPPFDFSIIMPPHVTGKQALIAIGSSNSQSPPVYSLPVTIYSLPGGDILSVEVDIDYLPFRAAGEERLIRFIGSTGDEQSVMLNGVPGFTAISGDPNVAVVDGDGTVRAISAGNATVRYAYGSLFVDVPVSIDSSLPGDLTGDGAVSEDDIRLLLVDVELGVQPRSPDVRDLNNDGVIDMQDVLLARDRCVSCNDLNIPPDVTAARPAKSLLWPPTHQVVDVPILGITDSDQESVAIRVDRIFQNEPTNSTRDGNTCPDAAGTGTDTAHIRAERAPGGGGRTYKIYFSATDARGGKSDGSVTICVPESENVTCSTATPPFIDATACTSG